jgi:hypothetical protein
MVSWHSVQTSIRFRMSLISASEIAS